MQTTRRNFIYTLAGVGAFVAFGGSAATVSGQAAEKGGLFPIPAEVYSEPLFSLTAKQFDSFLGSTFTATAEDGRHFRLVLTEVKSLEVPENTIGGYYGEVFSLVFEGPRKGPLVQGRYEIRIAGLPDFTALVVPISRGLKDYEIIVNHLGR
jgi:hypothetical protein